MGPAPMWTRNSVYGSSLSVPDEVPGIRPLSQTLLPSSSGRLETCGLARVGTLRRSADNRVSAVSDENGLKSEVHPQKFHGEDYDPESIKSERVMLWIVPERQTITNQSEGV